MHFPVLKKEILDCFDLRPGDMVIDCTSGEGGHSTAILEKINSAKRKGKILAIDLDINNLKRFSEEAEKRKLAKQIIFLEENFVNLKEAVKKSRFGKADAILFDLGISSGQLEESNRGFSFLKNEPLDMRLAPEKQDLSAETIVNYWSKEQLAKIISDYGGEKYGSRIAEKIIENRKKKKIETTFELLKTIKESLPENYCRFKIHFATKTFQAIRIAVNNDLENLRKALPQALDCLKKGGRLAVISFQSLEDRIVKEFFKKEAKKKTLLIFNKKPIIASKEELKINRRSRSAKLRVAIKN
jgi:16S rRNA (cytosine1402-N4)-methyltransferase